MEITQEEFMEKYLPGLRDAFVQKTQEHITRQLPEIQKKLKKNMDALLEILGRIQEEAPVAAGEIQIVLLHTSIAMGTPQVAYFVYGENGIFGREIMNIRYNASWLFVCWEEYQNALESKIKEINAQNSIRYEAVQQMRRQGTEFLVQTLYVVCKYLFMEMDKLEHYGDELFTDDFRLTVGEYMDWRKTLYIRRPATDIFFNTDSTPLSYGRFRTAVYSHKIFEDKDLTAAVFDACEFVHCQFRNVTLNDVRFVNCRMYYCTFERVTFLGTAWDGCMLKNLVFTDTCWNFTPDSCHLGDLYKPAELYGCTLEQIRFEQSDIRGIVQDGNSISGVSVTACEEDGTWNTIC